MKGKRSADSDSNMCLNTCCWLTKSTHAFLKASASVEFAAARIGASLMGVLAKYSSIGSDLNFAMVLGH